MPRDRDRDDHGDRAVRKEARREELLEAAIRAIRRDGAELSMEQLAAEAGVTKPILYRHFGDRSGLSAALGKHFSTALLTELESALQTEGEPRDVIVATIDAYISFIERDPHMYRFLVQRVATDLVGAASIEGFMRQVATSVALVLGEQLRQAGADSGGAEPIAHGIVGMVHAAGEWWLERQTMPRARRRVPRERVVGRPQRDGARAARCISRLVAALAASPATPMMTNIARGDVASSNGPAIA